MSKIEALEKQIETLSPTERAKLRDWFLEHDWQEWDRQLERDARSGKLDSLFERPLANHRKGKSKEL